MKKDKIVAVIVWVLILTIIGCSAEKEEIHSYVNITNNEKVMTVYYDGQDITGKRKAYEMLVENSISMFLNRDRKELEFSTFCMLEEEGCTVEVVIDKVSYTFTCGIEGNVVSVGRTDGEKCGIKGK